MRVWDLKFWNLFDARYKKSIWIILIVLVHVAIGLTVPRLFLKGPKTRSTTISLGMGAKSLVFIAYEVSTEYITKLQRWKSHKANTILNGLDIIFWGAVAFLNLKSNLSGCDGVGCYLGWAVVGVAILVNQIYVFATVMCWREWKGLTGGHQTDRREDGFEKASSNTSYAQMDATATVYHPSSHRGIVNVSDDQERPARAHTRNPSRSCRILPASQTEKPRNEVVSISRRHD